jgi:hypothetical protein
MVHSIQFVENVDKIRTEPVFIVNSLEARSKSSQHSAAAAVVTYLSAVQLQVGFAKAIEGSPDVCSEG